MNFYLSRPAVCSALGSGMTAHVNALLAPPKQSPLTFSDAWIKGKNLAFGAINEPLREFSGRLKPPHHSRNNQLLWHTLAQIEPQIEAAKSRYGANRIGVVIGTSTSGVDENIPMFQQFIAKNNWQNLPFNQLQHAMNAPAEFVADAYQLGNVKMVVSTACTSGARALMSAARLLQSGVCDAVICGGVDTLSPLTINGFAALEVLSPDVARPFSAHRNGINIGEAAAVFIMTRDTDFDGEMQLLGYGASSDAHHMSSPRPDGLGAKLAFQAALNRANLLPEHIGWINLHGTGTIHNDAMESHAVSEIFGKTTPCTSTKPLTGHTLGAAGAIEAAFAWLIANRETNPTGALPPQIWDGVCDADLPEINLTVSGCHFDGKNRIVSSSSFAFGGSNAVLIIGE